MIRFNFELMINKTMIEFCSTYYTPMNAFISSSLKVIIIPLKVIIICLGYNKPLQLFVEKRRFFNQNNQWLNNVHISLNSQFNVVLNEIICFSVRICDNPLLVLKRIFQVFFSATKKLQGFPSDRKMLLSLQSLLFYLQNRVSVFWNFNF